MQHRPAPGSDARTWADYLYARENVAGIERAWWFHRMGCRRWFQAERDTRTNTVLRSGWVSLDEAGSDDTGTAGTVDG